MSETIRQYALNELSEMYAKLNKEEVEQFYAGYQWWNLQQRAVTLQQQIEDLRREIAANAELMEMAHPPAIALATLARLQASGVNDLDLLDRMLERGEDWLDRTMQRLNYCEQLDFIIDNYTQWCQNALEGAYDWIDSMREGGTASSTEVPSADTSSEATEELLLQKLTSEDEEQASPLETAGKQAEGSALEEPNSEEPAPIIEQSPISLETPSSLEETRTESQAEQLSQPVEISPSPDSPVEATSASTISIEQPDQEEPSTTEPPIEPGPASDVEQSTRQEDSEPPTGEASEGEQLISQVYVEFDPAPEEFPPVEGDDGSDFRQTPLQEHSKDIFADESLTYWQESHSYGMYPPDKQPDSEASKPKDTEQARMQGIIMSKRRRNFLQQLVAKIWRR